MKLRLLLFTFLTCSLIGLSQDIPLFSQKLTNSFIYNPSFAGLDFGSLTFSHRNNYSSVKGAPVNNFMSLHSPIANGRFGVGANVFQEDVNILKNTYASLAFAYHLKFNKFTRLSFGVSGEMNSLQVNGADLNFDEVSQDVVLDNLRQGKNRSYDFSFGANYTNQYLKVGFALNRLGTAWLKADSTKLLTNFYSGFAQGMIRVRNNQDLFEPYVAFRKFSETNNTWDAGLFYTINDKISAGAAARKGGVFNFTLGYHLSKYLMVGYSREMLTKGGVGGFVGASNEFTIRLDFNHSAAKTKFSSDYKSSMAYRHKAITTSASKRTTSGSRNPKQMHKAQKKMSAFSPNARYQNMAKLSQGRKTPVKKQSYNKMKKGGRKPQIRKSPAKRKPQKYPTRRK